MSHPIQTWFSRHIGRPLTAMYALLDAHRSDDFDPQRWAARPSPVDVSWMPMPGSRARHDANRAR